MSILTVCACGCGQEVAPGKTWRRGHNNRNPSPRYIVDDATGCWNWQWAKDSDGYGIWRDENGKKGRAHRICWESEHGPIPDGMVIDHLCRNTSCVNPSHMEVVTTRENTLRGNNGPAQNARKTHCKRGHPLDETNTYVDPSGYRQCRKCRYMRLVGYRKARRAA